MTGRDLRTLLDEVPDTGDVVVRAPGDDAMLDAWRQAEGEAHLAYLAWMHGGGSDAYTTYRAAQDRADAAQDVLRLRAPAGRAPAAPA